LPVPPVYLSFDFFFKKS